MATSTLTSLPTELLDEIILHSLPEGFEGVALTCRKLYNLCTPSIERHNQLRKRFRDFTYLKYPNRDGLPSMHNQQAINLIQDIARDPVVARYIRHADFTYDTWPRRARPRRAMPDQLLPDPDLDEPVVSLFAESPCLREAGLDWREYYALIQEDLVGSGRYSQHAAAFLLTLLPNITSLKLPCPWRPCETADKLIHVILRGAVDRPSPSSSPSDRPPSLAQITKFEPYSGSGPLGYGFDLAEAVPFLALPKLRWFRAHRCVARNDASIAIAASEDAGRPAGAALEVAHFVESSLDDVAIAIFLRRTPNLKELAFSNCVIEGQASQNWDVCSFVAAIEREAGSYLESLKIETDDFGGPLAPGRLSMRGFQRLRRLHLPLEIVEYNLATDVSARSKELTDQELGELQRLTDILVPASVSELSLYSRDWVPDRHEMALIRVMFFNFAARKDGWVPALEDVRLFPGSKKDGAYKDECGGLKVEMMEAGVTLHLGDDPGEEEEWCEEGLI